MAKKTETKKASKKAKRVFKTKAEREAALEELAKEGKIGTANPPVKIYVPGDNPGIDVDSIPPLEFNDIFKGFDYAEGRVTSLCTGMKKYGWEGIAGLVPCFAMIPTPKGLVRAENLRPGDYIFAANGKPTKIVVAEVFGHTNYIEFTLKDGRTFNVSEMGLVATRRSYDKGYHGPITRQYRVPKEMHEMGMLKDRGYKFAVALGNPVEYPEQELEIHPYIMGIFLGDGCRNELQHIELSSDDIEIPDMIARIIGAERYVQQGKTYTWHFYNDDAIGWRVNGRYYYGTPIKMASITEKYLDLLTLHYAHQKYIPREYIYASENQRLQLICGLLDSEGCISKVEDEDQADRFNIMFSSTSLDLMEGLQEVIRSLGGSARIRLSKTPEKDGVKRKQYEMTITLDPKMKKSLFQVPRKRLLAEEAYEYKAKKDYTKTPIIDSKRSTGTRRIIRIEVESPEHLFIGENFVVMHDGSVYNVDPELTADLHYGKIC